VFSGNGTAAEHHRFPVLAGAPPSAVPRLDLIRPSCIQRPKIEDTLSVVSFSKKSLYFLYIEPAVQGVFWHRVFFF
jgi:hypothetical protein